MIDAAKFGLSRPAQVIAVTGGKGGVGKTSVSVNLSTAMAAAGKHVVLLDGDLGSGNADVFLGLSPRYTLADVLSGERTLDEVIIPAPQGFLVVPAPAGAAGMANLGETECLGLIHAFSTLAARMDVFIVDTAAGIVPSVLQFSRASQHVVVVICDEPASLTNAYALVKVLSRNYGVGRFRVLANQVRMAGSGAELFRRFELVTARFLDVVLEFAGEIPEDEYLRRSVREQRPVFDAYPSCPAARAFRKLAARAATWRPIPVCPPGHTESFVERLVRKNAASRAIEA